MVSLLVRWSQNIAEDEIETKAENLLVFLSPVRNNFQAIYKYMDRVANFW